MKRLRLTKFRWRFLLPRLPKAETSTNALVNFSNYYKIIRLILHPITN